MRRTILGALVVGMVLVSSMPASAAITKIKPGDQIYDTQCVVGGPGPDICRWIPIGSDVKLESSRSTMWTFYRVNIPDSWDGSAVRIFIDVVELAPCNAGDLKGSGSAVGPAPATKYQVKVIFNPNEEPDRHCRIDEVEVTFANAT